MICPYCQKEAIWTENKAIYGKNYGKSFMIWLCSPCDAYVGCHNNTKKPLGIITNKEGREWRKKAHAIFDPLWKSGQMSRDRAYELLNSHFKRDVHIGESDIETCKDIIDFLKDTQSISARIRS